MGQFHSGDSYVVRWLYTITVTGNLMAAQIGQQRYIEQLTYFSNINIPLI
jgi:hypothetical protein